MPKEEVEKSKEDIREIERRANQALDLKDDFYYCDTFSDLEGIKIKLKNFIEKQRKEKITNQIIQKSIPTGKKETKQKNIENLNNHQKTLYKIIKKEKTIKPGTLYKKYRKKIQEPRSNRTLRKYLEKMEHYNLITSQGKNKARKYSLKEKQTKNQQKKYFFC